MRKLGMVAGLLMVASLVMAGPQYISFECRNGTNAPGVLTDTKNPIGYIDEVYIQTPTTTDIAVVSGTYTADVCFISVPNVGSDLLGTVLYTNAAFETTVRARPRVTQTDNAGSNLSSLTVAERFLCNGDPVTFRVQQYDSVMTNVVVKGWIKIEN